MEGLSIPHSDQTLTCFRCGYDLRSLPDAGACPECGIAVAATRAHVERNRWRATRWFGIPLICAILATLSRATTSETFDGERLGLVLAVAITFLGAAWSVRIVRRGAKLNRLVAWCYLGVCVPFLFGLLYLS